MKRLEVSEEEKVELGKEYPFLVSDGGFNHMDDVPSGWLNIFKEFLPKLKIRLIEIDKLNEYKITQIKEKFGIIRVYDNFCDEKIIKLIQELEYKSEKTCIICGEPATYVSLGWISPYCTECKNHIEKKMKEDDMDKMFKEITNE